MVSVVFLATRNNTITTLLSIAFLLRKSTFLDSGATIYIFYNRSRFLNYRTALPNDYVIAGTTNVKIYGYGKVLIEVNSP